MKAAPVTRALVSFRFEPYPESSDIAAIALIAAKASGQIHPITSIRESELPTFSCQKPTTTS
jgi:hypothetical protein